MPAKFPLMSKTAPPMLPLNEGMLERIRTVGKTMSPRFKLCPERTPILGDGEKPNSQEMENSKVAIFGTLQNNNWTDDNGIKHYSNEIIGENIEFLSKINDEIERTEIEGLTPIYEEELPF